MDSADAAMEGLPSSGSKVPRRSKRAYASAVAGFDFEAVIERLGTASDGLMNAAEVCCDRHAGDVAKVALRHRSASGETREWTFAELKDRSARLADLLQSMGVA